MRLIDADDLRDFLSKVKARYNLFSDEERPFYEMHSKALDILNIYLDDAPTIEIKQGEWIPYKGMQPPEFHGKHYCSNCYHDLHLSLNGGVYNFCPKCGSKNKINTD